MAMQVILDAAISYSPGLSLNEESALLALRAFVDEKTILTPDVSLHDMPAVWMSLSAGAG